MACGCDACDTPQEPEHADGLCTFCATHCFPIARLSRGETRVIFSASSRAELHAYYTRSGRGTVAVAESNPAQQMLEEAAEELGRAAQAELKRAGRKALGALRRALIK